MDRYWFTWERQRRNIELSRALSCEYFEFNYDKKNRFVRYILSIYKTFLTIKEGRPKIVFGQNPSVVLVLTLILLRKIFKYKLVVDAHNSGIFPFEGRYRFANYMMNKINCKSDLLLVTNNELKKVAEKYGSRCFILQDKIPELYTNEIIKLDGNINFLFICKYNEDEPYLELFDAAKMINDNIVIYVTGNYRKLNDEILKKVPNNVRLIGFVPEKEYEIMIKSVDAVIDLTKRENCLLCGAYEAVAAEKPIILSNKIALKEYFKFGTIFVDNNPMQIKIGIENLIKDKNKYVREISEFKKNIISEWNVELNKLDNIISNQ